MRCIPKLKELSLILGKKVLIEPMPTLKKKAFFKNFFCVVLLQVSMIYFSHTASCCLPFLVALCKFYFQVYFFTATQPNGFRPFYR